MKSKIAKAWEAWCGTTWSGMFIGVGTLLAFKGLSMLKKTWKQTLK